jgi:hypothetical protein
MDAIRRYCPIECLAPLLSRQTMAALTAGMGSPATVGQVVELYEQRRLMEIYGISTGRLGEIKRSLVKAGLIEPGGRPVFRRRRPRDRSVGCGHCEGCPHHLGQSEEGA